MTDLNEKERIVLSYLMEKNGQNMAQKDIAKNLQITPCTLRKRMNTLAEKGYITKKERKKNEHSYYQIDYDFNLDKILK